MRKFLQILILPGALLLTSVALAELVIVVNPGSGVMQLDEGTLINIYMGRYQKLPSGVTAFPVDLSPERGSFYRQLVDKTLPEINSYWARLVFSGRASPPRQVQDPAEVIDIVSNNRGAIGYVDTRFVDERVRVVHGMAP